ncbi:hypothetical protein GJ496_010717 [Pomphorhynchus laevis]|nr:hypothetical protein GJ496_010717 [Pomphorhynchus laevis]
MGRSKRNKKVSLTKTTSKRTKDEVKEMTIKTVHSYVDEFPRAFIFFLQNELGKVFRELRTIWKPSRFLMSKHSHVKIGFGLNKATEYKLNLHEFGNLLIKKTGLLFTDKSDEYVTSWFSNFKRKGVLLTGDISKTPVVIKPGQYPQIRSSLVPKIIKLGMDSIRSESDMVYVDKAYTICEANEPLTKDQCQLMKYFEISLHTYTVDIVARWDKTSGNIKVF